MASPRCVVFAYSHLGHACLEYLIQAGQSVVAVFTHKDQPGETLWFSSVAELAIKNKIPVFYDENLKDPQVFKTLQEIRPELIFSFYYKNLIPMDVLALPKLGAFNMHGSYLPYYRGRAPVNWAVLNGETETGVTLHVMVEKADAGEIVDQLRVRIGADETAIQVQEQVTAAAVQILRRQLSALNTGSAPRKAQDLSQGGYFGRRRPEDGRVNWSQSSEKIHNLIRAVTHPFPGAFTTGFGKNIYLWASQKTEMQTDCIDVGQINIKGRKLCVACGDARFLEITRIQPEGEAEVSGEVFAATFLKQVNGRKEFK